MLENLYEFLINQKKRRIKSSIQPFFWKQKKEFLESVLIEYLPYWRALSSSVDSNIISTSEPVAYHDAFELNLENIKAENIQLPVAQNLSEVSKFKFNDFWAKLIQDDTTQIHFFGEIIKRPLPEIENVTPDTLILYFQLLIIYYAYLAPVMPYEITVRIDFFTTRLVWQCGALISAFDWGGAHIDRTRKSTDKKRKEKAKKKQEVLETYYQISRRGGLKPHRLATLIMERIGEKSPSLLTIKRYLKEDGLI